MSEWTDAWTSDADARERGRALRDVLGHDGHAEFTAPVQRPSVTDFLARRNADRDPALVPLGHGRMSADAFAFFRGTAGLMAHDLAGAPVTGVIGQLCGDAHAGNFGLYGTDDGRIVIDINDFDETVAGPWEWDLKRLATSLVLAGRTGSRVGDDATRKAARHAAKAYRKACKHLAGLSFLDSWTALGDESAIERANADELFDDFESAAAKAVRNTSERVATKLTARDEDEWRFVPDPPVLTAVDAATRDAVVAALREYPATLHESRRRLVARYAPRDVAMRIVGTGSVGMRSYVVLLQGNDAADVNEALVLQVKQAGPSALAPYVTVGDGHDGERVVAGARLVQSETDLLFGWATVDLPGVGPRPFVVRQFRNRKGSIDPTVLTADHLDDYARLAGSLLARAHCRTIDPRVLAGYLEKGKPFDLAVADFAFAYAGRAEDDYAAFMTAIDGGELAAEYED